MSDIGKVRVLASWIADIRGIGEGHGPVEAEAELSASLGVGCDPAGIVVGRAGDPAWAERLKDGRAISLAHLYSAASGVVFCMTVAAEADRFASHCVTRNSAAPNSDRPRNQLRAAQRA